PWRHTGARRTRTGREERGRRVPPRLRFHHGRAPKTTTRQLQLAGFGGNLQLVVSSLVNWRELLAPAIVGDPLMGVPFASRDPRSRKAAAAIEAYEILSGFRMQVNDLDQQIRHPNLLRRTRDRLKALRDATDAHLRTLDDLFRPLGSVPFSEVN